MIKSIVPIVFLMSYVLTGCQKDGNNYSAQSSQSKIIEEMIGAVNDKNADQYVKKFAKNVRVYVDSELKVDGREALKANRANHFRVHPNVRSEIQHLVEIDNKVIMHDKVWLDQSEEAGQDIVEIFTFENGKVVKVKVIQPDDLFRKASLRGR